MRKGKTLHILGITHYITSIVLFMPFICSAQESEKRPEEPASVVEITITANPLEPSLLESGHPVSLLDRDQVIQRNQSTLGETINLEPGVTSSYSGPGSSRPVIRGFAGDRVKILKNGLAVGDVSNISEDHATAVDPLGIQAIEILRGPETLLYGSSAIGGSVNVVDNAIPEKAIGAPLKGEYLIQQGDAATGEQSASMRLKGQEESLNWTLSGFIRDTDNIEIPGYAESEELRALEQEDESEPDQEARGTLPNSDTRTRGFTAGLSQVLDSGYVGLSFSSLYSDYGLPGAGHEHHEHEDHDFAHEDDHEDLDLDHEEFEDQADSMLEAGPRIELEQHRVELRGQFDKLAKDIESLKLKAALSLYQHDELEPEGALSSSFQQDSIELRSDLVHSLLLPGRGVLGTQWSYEEFSAQGLESFIEPVDSFSPALFAFHEIPLSEKLELHLGSRVEYVQRDPLTLENQDFLPFNVSLGLEWDPTASFDYLVALHFAYTERAPSSSELYADGPHLARGIYEIGDSSLGLESSWGFDLTLRKNYGLLTAGITPFWQVFSNYLNLAGSSDTVDDLPVFYYQEIEAEFYGFEAETSLAIDRLLKMYDSELALDLQLDYVRARDTDADSPLPRIPPLRTITRLRYENQLINGFLEGVFVSAQNDTADYELSTDAYQFLNAHLEFKLPVLEQYDLRLFARGSNLTNDEGRVHSSFLKDNSPLTGRAFLFGIRGTI